MRSSVSIVFPAFFLGLFCTFVSCRQKGLDSHNVAPERIMSLHYAKGFSVKYYSGFRLLEVHDPWKGAHKEFRLIIAGPEISLPASMQSIPRLYAFPQRMAALSCTHIAPLELLGELSHLTAVGDASLIFSRSVRSKIKSQQIVPLGSEESLNMEELVKRKTDLVLCFGINQDFLQELDRLEAMHQQVLPVAEYMESHPLGQAEWIRFYGALCGKENLADSIFAYVEKDYLQLAAGLKNVRSIPVTVNAPWNGIWYVPGGDGFMSTLFQDAGASYPWSDRHEKGSLSLSFEEVFVKSLNAKFWFNPGSAGSKAALLKMDERFGELPVFLSGNLWTYDKRSDQSGANDYWESGLFFPNLVLKDMIQILHPEMIDGRELFYYRKLQ